MRTIFQKFVSNDPTEQNGMQAEKRTEGNIFLTIKAHSSVCVCVCSLNISRTGLYIK